VGSLVLAERLQPFEALWTELAWKRHHSRKKLEQDDFPTHLELNHVFLEFLPFMDYEHEEKKIVYLILSSTNDS
jgi:hypothetical protein